MRQGLYSQINAFQIQIWFFNLLLGSAHIIQPQGILAVQPDPLSPFSPPHFMFPRGTNIEWVFTFPIRRFGGYFRSFAPSTYQADFYDVNNNLIASIPFSLSTNWVWRGACHVNGPLIKRIIITNTGGFRGLIAHDNTRIRYN